MKKILMIFIGMFFIGMNVLHAGVAARDISGGTSSYKGVFSDVVCDKGVECVKAGPQLKIRTNPVKTALTFTSGDTTPSVASGTFFNSFLNNAVTVTTFDDGYTGQEIIVYSQGAVTFDVTSTTLKCGSTDVVTASGDVSRWVYGGTNWNCTSFIDASDNLN